MYTIMIVSVYQQVGGLLSVYYNDCVCFKTEVGCNNHVSAAEWFCHILKSTVLRQSYQLLGNVLLIANRW